VWSHRVDCGFESRPGLTKNYRIGICSFSTKHAALRRKTKDKDWMARNQDNVSKWSDISIWDDVIKYLSVKIMYLCMNLPSHINRYDEKVNNIDLRLSSTSPTRSTEYL
jgi:hypothetical protein